MMLGFKRRFAPFVKDGSKRHTIRGRSNRKPPKVGEILHCYVDPRQKTMALLGRWPCVKVEEIRIFHVRLGKYYDHPAAAPSKGGKRHGLHV